jgi:hypothetical protein
MGSCQLPLQKQREKDGSESHPYLGEKQRLGSIMKQRRS